ncbi:AAA family ATPase [Larkinella terrae]|uniref:AAA family ATPase n=2 Tax=Larkinella terrae TaxID=2025311 RepID=A0A7K0EKM5_9BACT|nr:AAA family ATPase [Larkinella terrae]
MIKPEEFPYIKSLHVNDCYAYKDFDIVLHDYQPFSHLILTGKNGSGKSTILRAIDNYILSWRGKTAFIGGETDPIKQIYQLESNIAHRASQQGNDDSTVKTWQKKLIEFKKINLGYTVRPNTFWPVHKSETIYSFLQAKREIPNKIEVNTVTKEADFTDKLLSNSTTESFIKEFKQYLVNQKVYQAFNQLNNDKDKIENSERFFIVLTDTFRKIFEDDTLELVFVQESFEFYIKLSDSRQLTFDTLSEGFSALLSILMDLFMRVDLIRKQVGDYSYNPCGIVLIDEPETHLHLELQYQVLPLLASLFPNIQFIAATHSPAVISSVKKATIFDLTTKVTETDDVAGKSYSELMVTHFGLENEYSNIADEIISQVNLALRELKEDKIKLRQKLEEILEVNGQYLSPTLRVELESMILQNV